MSKKRYVVGGCPECRIPLEEGKCPNCNEKVKKKDRIKIKLKCLKAKYESKGVSYCVPIPIVRKGEGEEIPKSRRFGGIE